MGFPASELDFITSLNESVVRLPHDLMIEETQADLVGQVGYKYEVPVTFPTGEFTSLLNNSLKMSDLLKRDSAGAPLTDPSWLDNVSWNDVPDIRAVDGTSAVWDAVVNHELLHQGDVPVKEVGVPQGAPTSCSLATLALRPLEQLIDCVLYADDGVYAPHTSDVDPVVVVSNPVFGVQANPKKIRWLKKEGK